MARRLVAPQCVESSGIRDQTCVSCIGRWILYHCATREALTQRSLVFSKSFIILALTFRSIVHIELIFVNGKFFGRNDAKAETPVLWPPHAKS